MEACPQFLDYPLSDIGTHLIALYSLNNNVAYFDNFGAEQSSKECLNTKTWQTSQLFSPNNFKKNDDLILNYFKNRC